MVQVELQIDIDGELEEGQLNRAMTVFGELVINKVKQNIRDMDLISKSGAGGAYLQGWLSNWDGTSLTIENTKKYATYLEYGTYGYWNKYGTDNFPDEVPPKKKDMARELWKNFPKGVPVFAPVRRVLYNNSIIEELLQIAFNNSI